MCVHVPEKVAKENQIPCTWSYRWLWVVPNEFWLTNLCFLQKCALNFWATFSAPYFNLYYTVLQFIFKAIVNILVCFVYSFFIVYEPLRRLCFLRGSVLSEVSGIKVLWNTSSSDPEVTTALWIFSWSLRHCLITISGCQDLAEVLRKNQNLRNLQVSNNKIEDAGVKLLCDAIKHPNCHLKDLQWVSSSL